jgi:hypothetical protein
VQICMHEAVNDSKRRLKNAVILQLFSTLVDRAMRLVKRYQKRIMFANTPHVVWARWGLGAHEARHTRRSDQRTINALKKVEQQRTQLFCCSLA